MTTSNGTVARTSAGNDFVVYEVDEACSMCAVGCRRSIPTGWDYVAEIPVTVMVELGQQSQEALLRVEPLDNERLAERVDFGD